MNYFNEIEKSLKRYLKSKVTISVATIVGFMITGAIAFGESMMQEIPNGAETITSGNYYGETLARDKERVVDGTEVTEAGPASQGVNAARGETSYNYGSIWVKGGSKGYAEGMGTSIGNSEETRSATIINKGNIYVVDGSKTKVKGMGVNPGGVAINEGLIVVNSGSGMTDNSGGLEKSIINETNGRIVVEGSGAGIYYRKEAVDTQKGCSIENKGKIEVTGAGKGVYVSDDKFEESYYGKNFINSGSIIATAEGATAVFSTSQNFTLSLKDNSHIEGNIKLLGKNNAININGVGKDSPETIKVEGNDAHIEVTNSNIVIEGNIKRTGDGVSGTEILPVIRVDNQGGTSDVTNVATITGAVGMAMRNVGHDTSNTATDNTVVMRNNGIINASLYGVYANGWYQNYNKFEIENNKEIIVKGAGDEVIGINASTCPLYNNNDIGGNTGKVVNNGLISVKTTGTETGEVKAIGVSLHENTNGYNNGEIVVTAKGGIGVSATSGTDEKNGTKVYFENSGKIEVIGENDIGLLLKETDTAGKIEAVNDSTGVITVNGNNAIAVKVDGKNSEFKNMGMLVLGAEGTDKKAIVTDNGGTATSTGIIKVEGTELAGVTTKDEAIEKLFDGENIKVSGLIVDKDGNDLFASGDEVISDDTSGDVINIVAKENDGEIKLDASGENGITLTAGKEDIKTDAFNVVGGVVKVSGEDSVNIESDSINLDAKGKLAIDEDAQLNLSNGTLNKVGEDKTAVVLSKGATLTLNHMDIHGDITADENTGESQVNVAGETKFDGNINVKNINIGNVTTTNLEDSTTKDNKLFLSSTSVIGTKVTGTAPVISADEKNTVTIGTNGQLVLEVGANGDTALSNSTGVTVTVTGTGAGVDENADILLSIGNLSGEKVSVDLGKENGNKLSGSIGIDNASEVYELINDNNSIVLAYNKNLFAGDSRLNSINNGAVGVSNLFSTDKLVRSAQLTRILDGSIYSETAKASYNSIKLAEETLRGMDRIAEVGKWAAKGSALYNKHTYDRAGYDSDIETSGLLGAMEYGIDDNTAVGVAFGGAYQDVDSATGDADGTTLYLGTYAKKVVGAYSLTAGVGYQYGNYDANNVTGSGSSSDTYDSNAVSTYVEGRYKIDLGDNVSFQPKAKLGYTYVKQDKAQDAYIGVSDAELSTFDTEIGADLVKTYAQKDGKANLVFGASYVRAYGDTDKDFRGQFANSADKFNINGAMLSENTGKFNFDIRVSKDNGLFYNGGVNLNIGDDNTRDYGVNLGVGYRF